MTEIEKYAISMVGDGGESVAEDDLDEDGVFGAQRQVEHHDAMDLGVKMARAIKDNPEAFLAWYHTIAPVVVE